MNKIIIYGLVSSEEPNKLRYIGKTKQKLDKRIHDHIRESFKFKTKKDYWIQSVIANNNKIWYVIVEKCEVHNWLEREKYWISLLPDLMNTSKGGDGGRGLIANKTYDELKKFVHTHMKEVTNKFEWVSFVIEHPEYSFLPKHPYQSYKNRGWVSWNDLLVGYKENISGRRNSFREIFTYIECKDYIQPYKILDSKDWRKHKNKFDLRIPTAPDVYYTKTGEWNGWGEFLSNGNISNKRKKILSYSEATKVIKNYNFSKKSDFQDYINKNGLIEGIPYHPNRYYNKTNEWTNWVEFLT